MSNPPEASNNKTAKAQSSSRRAYVISLISLIISAITLYETVLKQPRVRVFAGCGWHYRRGPGSEDEFFVIPLTLANLGARGGVVTSIEMTANREGFTKEFEGAYIVTALDEKTADIYSKRQLFTPLALAGRDSRTVTVMMTQRQRTTPAFIPDDWQDKSYRVRLKLATSLDLSYGRIDRMLASRAPDAIFELHLDSFNMVQVIGGAAGKVKVCGQSTDDRS